MLSRLPPKDSRQTLLFSATMPSDVRGIAGLGMRANYAIVDTVGQEENTHQHVPQHVLVTSKEAQARELLLLVQEAMQVRLPLAWLPAPRPWTAPLSPRLPFLALVLA